MNIINEIFKLMHGGNTPEQKKIFVKEIDILKIEPWISIGNFDIEHADVLLEDIHKKQYMRNDMFVIDVYKSINLLIEGAYISGLNDAKDMCDEDIDTRTKKLLSKVETLRWSFTDLLFFFVHITHLIMKQKKGGIKPWLKKKL